MICFFLVTDMAISHISFLLKIQDKQGICPFALINAFLMLWFLVPVNVRNSASLVSEKWLVFGLFSEIIS